MVPDSSSGFTQRVKHTWNFIMRWSVSFNCTHAHPLCLQATPSVYQLKQAIARTAQDLFPLGLMMAYLWKRVGPPAVATDLPRHLRLHGLHLSLHQTFETCHFVKQYRCKSKPAVRLDAGNQLEPICEGEGK